MKRNWDDEIGERERMMGNTFGEEGSERIGGRVNETILQRENEFLNEAMAVWPSDEKSVEGGRFSTVAAGCTILLVGSPTDRAFLVLSLWNGLETAATGERALAIAAEAMEREEEIGESSSERGQRRAGSRVPAA